MYRNLKPLILASASPRRKELLESVGIAFAVIPADIIEKKEERETPEQMVCRLAEQKALHVARQHPDTFVLAVDTDVIFKGEVYGKPANLTEAEAMLGRLSGNTHSVVTAAALCCLKQNISALITTKTNVAFRTLSSSEIRAYVRADSVLDKAGAYGAQQVGQSLVASIDGSFSSVIGLDLSKTVELLLKHEVVNVREY